MKINKSMEEAIVVCLMLAVQKSHEPIDSETLSKIMGVSDSYLKKTLRSLAVAGIVNATAGKAGGYALAKPANKITFADVFCAMEPEAFMFKGSPCAQRVFPDCKHITAGETKIAELFSSAGDAFLKELNKHKLSEVLKATSWQNGEIDWRKTAAAL